MKKLVKVLTFLVPFGLGAFASTAQQVIVENTALKTEKEALSTTLTQTVDDFTAKNNDLKRQVTLASAMKAINVQVTALSSKGKELTELSTLLTILR